MILAVVLAALLLCFMLMKHNIGVPFLAMIAGLAVHEAFGEAFASTIHVWMPAVDEILAQQILYVGPVPMELVITLAFEEVTSNKLLCEVDAIDIALFSVLLYKVKLMLSLTAFIVIDKDEGASLPL